jgi:hypothetical protein
MSALDSDGQKLLALVPTKNSVATVIIEVSGIGQ